MLPPATFVRHNVLTRSILLRDVHDDDADGGDADDEAKKICVFPISRLTIFSPTYSGFFIVRLKVFFIGDHIEKK